MSKCLLKINQEEGLRKNNLVYYFLRCKMMEKKSFTIHTSIWLRDTIDTGDVYSLYRCACAYNLAQTGTHPNTHTRARAHTHTSSNIVEFFFFFSHVKTS